MNALIEVQTPEGREYSPILLGLPVISDFYSTFTVGFVGLFVVVVFDLLVGWLLFFFKLYRVKCTDLQCLV